MKRQTRGALRVPLLILALVFTACTFGGVLSGGFNTLFGSITEQTAAAAAAWNRPSDDALLSENRRLTEENSRLKAALAGYAEAKDENEKLWRFYDMKKDTPALSLKPAAVLRRGADDDCGAFTLGVGEADGVSVNDPVVTENGLIGRVTRVDAAACSVSTVLSPDLSVSVTDRQSGGSGVLSGTAALADSGRTAVTLLSGSSKMKTGDFLYTSGAGGVYPKNLFVGTITEVSQERVLAKPCEDIGAVTFAAVITDFSGKGVPHLAD